ncbi:aconitase family protein [Clostridium magnum]|uniref:aconitase family protein n=1 Tax=Clostridium magnum TaxID=33954 RepID=UPI001114E0DD
MNLKAYHIDKDTRLVVIPASAEVFQKAMKLGYVDILITAGPTFTSPGCGPCLGTHAGLLAV